MKIGTKGFVKAAGCAVKKSVQKKNDKEIDKFVSRETKEASFLEKSEKLRKMNGSSGKDRGKLSFLEELKQKGNEDLRRLAECEMNDFLNGSSQHNPLITKNSYCSHYLKVDPDFANKYDKKAKTAGRKKLGTRLLISFGIPAAVLGGLYGMGALGGGTALVFTGIAGTMGFMEHHFSP